MKPVTDKQKVVYDFICDYTARNGFAPTLREIGDHIGKPVSHVKFFCDQLRVKGWLDWDSGVARSWRTLK